jgi:hypothetical protein
LLTLFRSKYQSFVITFDMCWGRCCENCSGHPPKAFSLKLSLSFYRGWVKTVMCQYAYMSTCLHLYISTCLHAYMPITSEPCGNFVLKMLIKFNGPHTWPRKQWQLCSSMGYGCISLIFCLKIRRWMQSALLSIEHIAYSI